MVDEERHVDGEHKTSELCVADIWKISSVSEGGAPVWAEAPRATARESQCGQYLCRLRSARYLASVALAGCCIPSAVATMGVGTDASEMHGHAVDVQNDLDLQEQRDSSHDNTTGRHQLTSMEIQHEQHVLIVAVLALLGMLFAVLWVFARSRLTADEAWFVWQRLTFRLKVCSLVGSSYFTTLVDWVQLFIFFKVGFRLLGLINLAILVLPPLVTFVFFSFVMRIESKWAAPLYILQKHVLDYAYQSWAKGIVFFTLVWAVAFAACFEAMPSSLLGTYAVIIAPEVYFSSNLKIPAFLVCGPLVHPGVITSFSVMVGVINVAKILSQDLES